jgi:hypothetical protein
MVGAAGERQCLGQSPHGLAVDLRLIHYENPSQLSSLTSQLRQPHGGAGRRDETFSRRADAQPGGRWSAAGCMNNVKMTPCAYSWASAAASSRRWRTRPQIPYF